MAADGRKFHFESGTVASDSVQKIFGIKEPHRQLAYCLYREWSGAKDGDEVIFDYAIEVAKAMTSL